ncbi:hypothetical protein B0W47_14165 [Komagataeibacter nataicola]|uniref:Sodium:solute symporter n=2 Tax=Komagataeibacter nataicola TaxID=265960 RepID=A0A9N7CZ77_9PROT|nr:hypothetical protein [Komagataeibacter nataicola]AQU88411.1 hypothetical protein B0W47_14165 [Komagataeibacter nataicola]PYD65216.1 sodium:solute symporter [Komagataeibacter nataicola]GBR21444.1 Na+/solute symporter [Komagataeibacter nataicola NRIC 0616]
MASFFFVGIISLAFAFAVLSRYGHARQSNRDFFVASGQFGTFLVFMLGVGETYSIGSLLGFPAAAERQGVSFVLWYMGFLILAYPVGYFVNPLIWKAGQRYNAITFADLFQGHFKSPFLEKIIVFNVLLCLIPLGELQFAGILNIVNWMHWNISPLATTSVAALLAFGWILISGIRAPAYVSVMKDLLILLVVIGVGFLAFRAIGSHGGYTDISRMGPVPDRQDELYAVSTIILQAIGFCVAPQMATFLFTARSARVVRRSQIAMPLYMLMFPFLYLVAVYVHVTKLPLPAANDVFMAAANALLPPWALGIVASAGVLSGLVILAGTCLVLGPLIARNLLPAVSDRIQGRSAKIAIALYLVFSVMAASHMSALMVTLTSFYYMGIIQMAPGLASVLWRIPAPPLGIAMGIVVGESVTISLVWTGARVGGCNVAIFGLAANMACIAMMWGGHRWYGRHRNT